MALFDNARVCLDPERAARLWGEINVIRSLPGARDRRTERGAWIIRSTSVGRPEFDYEGVVTEMQKGLRRRIRIVERWVGRHGLLRLWMQHIHLDKASILDEDKVVTSEGKRVKVYEEPSNTQLIVYRAALVTARGNTYGAWEKHQDTYSPLPPGFNHEAIDEAEHETSMNILDPLLAMDYEHSQFDGDAADMLLRDLVEFREGEARLASLRRAISGRL